MPGNLSPAERRAELDARLESALDAADAGGLSLARSSVRECPDRWYGQLAALSHDAARGSDASTGAGRSAETVLTASTAVELLRGYCRVRSGLLAELDDGSAREVAGDPTAALLAGDYLNSAAYAALASVDGARDAFEALLAAAETAVTAFESRGVESAGDARSFLDETAGSLGGSAAAVGAALAGVDAPRRERFATVGRGVSTARQVRRVLGSGDAPAIAPPEPDERRLREHATRRLAEAERALDTLETADSGPLRTFVAEELPGFGPP